MWGINFKTFIHIYVWSTGCQLREGNEESAASPKTKRVAPDLPIHVVPGRLPGVGPGEGAGLWTARGGSWEIPLLVGKWEVFENLGIGIGENCAINFVRATWLEG